LSETWFLVSLHLVGLRDLGGVGGEIVSLRLVGLRDLGGLGGEIVGCDRGGRVDRPGLKSRGWGVSGRETRFLTSR